MINQNQVNDGLCSFIKASPTPFHAVEKMSERLISSGYECLSEGDPWQLESGKSYFVVRNSSSIIAFNTGSGDLFAQGFNIIGTHTDSPCLKVKPQAGIVSKGYCQLGVEVYGGALLNPWFDRDLSLAGRVSYINKEGKRASCLIDFEKAVASIPSLAIHLDSEANTNRSINAQKDLPPVLLQTGDTKSFDFHDLLLSFLHENLGLVEAEKILSYELSFYDTQSPAVIGFNDEFIASARLDNLLSTYIGLEALLSSDQSKPSLLVCSDHEEVGSVSSAGAAGSFFEAVIERIAECFAESKEQEAKRRLIDHSMLVSVDNAHGIHPNYPDKHDQRHGPLLNHGPVLKVNANQRYASNSETIARFQSVCDQEGLALQNFVVRSDMGCGSTIGPIVAAELGVKTLDLGVPTFAMHSIREMAGVKDTSFLLQALSAFLNSD